MRDASASLACMLLMSVLARATDIAFLQNVERRIQKEPEYIAKQPLYGLLVLGPSAQKSIATDVDVELVNSTGRK